MNSDLGEVTKALGEHYREWKAAEKSKNESKTEFFEVATEKIRDEDRPTKVVTLYGPDEDTARARCLRYYPTWKIKAISKVEDGEHSFLLEEDPDYAPYTYVNPEDGMVYSRQVAAGKLHLDDDLLKEQDPELYERVTHIPQERQLKPFEELSDDDTAAVQDYIYEGKPTVKLGAPRKAKPEELEDAA